MLQKVNESIPKRYDWKVTICFYVAVHIINGHIAKTVNEHFKSHKKVNDAISPYSKLSPCSLTENCFLSYKKLQGLARRSRYLLHEGENLRDEAINESAYFTEEKHFQKAIKNLDHLLSEFSSLYDVDFQKISIKTNNCKKVSTNHISLVELSDAA